MVRWNTHANFVFAELVNSVHSCLLLQSMGFSLQTSSGLLVSKTWDAG